MLTSDLSIARFLFRAARSSFLAASYAVLASKGAGSAILTTGASSRAEHGLELNGTLTLVTGSCRAEPRHSKVNSGTKCLAKKHSLGSPSSSTPAVLALAEEAGAAFLVAGKVLSPASGLRLL